MKIYFAIAVALALAAGGLFAGVLRESNTEPSAVTAEPVRVAELRGGETLQIIARLQEQIQTKPDAARAHALLGLAYLQRARETGDPANYTPAQQALDRAVELDATNLEAILGLGSLALSRHRFADALALGRRAEALAPEASAPLGVIGDALLELGRYPAAFATFDRLAARRPDVTSYARIAYAREVSGDVEGAIEVMGLAVDAAGTGPSEPGAFARAQLGNLILPRRPAEAAAIYEEALRLRPGYTAALLGLGATEEAAGRLEAALALYRRALASAPDPGAAIAVGDVLKRLGRKRGAVKAYERAHELEQRFVEHGGFNALESAMLDLDLDRRIPDALRRARIGHAARPSVEGEHVLAWALYKNGRCAEARRHSIRHLRLGTPDSDGIYHRVLIERCLGNDAAARTFLARLETVEPGYLAAPPSDFRLR